MTTAEKRAELAARGEPWPVCECHGEPCRWGAEKNRKDGGRFRCRHIQREYMAKRRSAFAASGGCHQCGHPDLTTETMCEHCSTVHSDANWNYERTSHRQLTKYLWNMRRRINERASDGYAPTEQGQTLLMDEFSKGST